MCGSVKIGGNNPKNVWWNDVVKAPWKEVLGARDEVVWRFTNKERFKKCIYQSKKEVNEQFRKKVNEDVDRNRKWFWNGGKVGNCSRIKNGNGRG